MLDKNEINDKKLEEIKNDVTEIIGEAHDIKISDAESYEKATKFIGEVKQAITGIERMRKAIVQPLNDVVSGWNTKFKVRTTPLMEAGKLVKSKMIAYATEQQRIADEKEAERKKEQLEKERIEQEKIVKEKAKEEALRKKAENEKNEKKKKELEAKAEVAKKAKEKAEEDLANTEIEPVEAPVKTVQTDSGSSTTRKIKKVKVVDFSKLPDKYKVADNVLIRRDALSGEEIPGVEIREELDIAVRT
ncbi:MAG: hypothetical protein V3U02_04420 [Calditrichia bacterium]